jgi:hypothetical protein
MSDIAIRVDHLSPLERLHVRTFARSNVPRSQRSNVPTFQRSNVSTCQRSNDFAILSRITEPTGGRAETFGRHTPGHLSTGTAI